ncbi:16S rRNA (guanine(527)-N(7))-methyltransferase RsmG [Aquisalinus flavus]|uniref:Ribosomal RNA small subunit methyltransferase G n=1 Tax=Aquisalinus flavus TaxID=1526572 RepID=A0A8J2Y873_9PROT|nr:16S rRNA (guanine(527)-N(7))-methyltransferase RsmG [Aquisalinus flavus]MBD0425591.1 16S rRNA (guanine(527)-N(7))-methyltransferase RsmG [Aquisalinus flavus]UNE48787.1 16S rRNA (guanine(527)-N(7))-methyltransferase RsmG [Aquisalinus flavus]GGD14827.1 ribosomal RNA small subunit methyltransferase G [Aquisalinus flavus]
MVETPHSLTEFVAAFPVSRETSDKIAAFDALFLDWAARLNLVAKSSVEDRWTRHYLDSAQILPLLPKEAKRIVDLGSGGGFPALFLALIDDHPKRHYFLVESIAKKCAFLREVAIKLDLGNVTIINDRIESRPDLRPADVVTARALAGLSKLLAYALPISSVRTMCIFMKGEKAEEELTAASGQWKMDVTRHPSRTHEAATILEIRNIARAR